MKMQTIPLKVPAFLLSPWLGAALILGLSFWVGYSATIQAREQGAIPASPAPATTSTLTAADREAMALTAADREAMASAASFSNQAGRCRICQGRGVAPHFDHTGDGSRLEQYHVDRYIICPLCNGTGRD